MSSTTEESHTKKEDKNPEASAGMNIAKNPETPMNDTADKDASSTNSEGSSEKEADKRESRVLDAASALTSLTSSMKAPDVTAATDSDKLSSNEHSEEENPSDGEKEDGDQHEDIDMANKQKGAREKAIRFPVKLMAILSSDEYEDIISWTPDGESFVIKKPSALVSKVLPYHFKEVKYSSFTRKLHRWGFTKLLRGRDMSAYSHKKFKRGNLELCQEMRCCNKPISHQPTHIPGNPHLQPRPGPNLGMAAALSSQLDGEIPHHSLLEYEAAMRYAQQQRDLSNSLNPRHQQTAFANAALGNSWGAPYDPVVRSNPEAALYQAAASRGANRYPGLSAAASSNAALARVAAQQSALQPSPYPLSNIGLASSNHTRIIENAWNALARELNPRKPQISNNNNMQQLLRNDLLNHHRSSQQYRADPSAGRSFGQR